MLISRAVTVKSRVTPNLRSQLAAETQKAMRELDAEAAKAGSEKERSDLLARKDDLVRQLKEIAKLEDGQEVVRGQVQGFWELRVGDIWPLVLSSEIVIEDGRVVEIREGQAVSIPLDAGVGGSQK
ncbi:MAG: YlqD family protein [Bacillota bacterium]